MYAKYSFSNCQNAVVQIALQLPVVYAVKSHSGEPKQKIYGYDRVDTFIFPTLYKAAYDIPKYLNLLRKYLIH